MVLVYDNTFEGFLTVIFECYSRKLEPLKICSETFFQENIFNTKETIATDINHADRVWKGLQSWLRPEIKQIPYYAFLSGEKGIELTLLHFIRLAFASPVPIDDNFGDPNVLAVRKAARKVTKEAMRMLQFIRFQRTRDDIYFAPISPLYDVLPMVLKHFKSRFADQRWIIYDLKRDYGFFYDCKTVEEVVLKDKLFHAGNGAIISEALEEDEKNYQSAWKDYCQNLTIVERLNLRLQKQHMPKRYWKFLPEKIA